MNKILKFFNLNRESFSLFPQFIKDQKYTIHLNLVSVIRTKTFNSNF